MNNKTICRLCGATKNRYLFAVNGCHVVSCNRCSFVQVANNPTQMISDLYSEKYFRSSKYDDVNTLAKENKRRLDLMYHYLPVTNALVLEAGCGSGEFIAHAGPVYKMHGFDISAAAIETARQRNPQLIHNLRVGTVEQQELLPGSFDAVCAWDVIEHLWDPVGSCQKLFECLKPGGFLFLSTPNIGAPIAKLLGRYWPFMTPPEHLCFFNQITMQYLAENHLQGKLLDWQTKGKTVNVGFILYKLKRVLPLVPEFIVRWGQKPPLSRLSLYVPTKDIQYAVIAKPFSKASR